MLINHRSGAYPDVSERAICTCRISLRWRVEADKKKGKQHLQRIDDRLEILLARTSKIKTFTETMPKEARKLQMSLKSGRTCLVRLEKKVYPELGKGVKSTYSGRTSPMKRQRWTTGGKIDTVESTQDEVWRHHCLKSWTHVC